MKVGIAIFVVVFALFGYLQGALRGTPATLDDYWTALGTALFFAYVTAYAVAGGAHALSRSRDGLLALKPRLDIPEAEFTHHLEHTDGASYGLQIGLSVIALVCGVCHAAFLEGGFGELIESLGNSLVQVGNALGTCVAWFVLWHFTATLVMNVRRFAQLSERCEITQGLTMSELRPFGTAALAPAVALAGIPLAFLLLMIGGEFNSAAIVPGLLTVLFSLVYVILRPIWPLHKRLLTAKTSALQDVDNQIARVRGSAVSLPAAADLKELQPLLAYREYLSQLPAWPFDVAQAARVAFYVFIPPLTWVLAALVEVVVDGFVG